MIVLRSCFAKVVSHLKMRSKWVILKFEDYFSDDYKRKTLGNLTNKKSTIPVSKDKLKQKLID
jgi:hypothetical protein